MITKLQNNLYSIQVPLPDNPLKWLNAYIIRGENGGRNLLIDTGFKRPECVRAILDGFKILDIEPGNTDVFLSHVHSDHTGNAPEFKRLGCHLIMGKTDHRVLLRDTWAERKQRAINEGMSAEVMDLVFRHNPAVKYAPDPFDAEEIEAGTVLAYADYLLTCIETPGHTPGHICLYDSAKQIMFCGDYVLFDITPNICFWMESTDSLGDYLESLDRIDQYCVKLALPGHRAVGEKSFTERIAELKEHHAARLNEAERVVHKNPGINAYDLAGNMTWRIRARNWDEFPPGQKWFALGETLAHLDYLVARERIERCVDADGMVSYR